MNESSPNLSPLHENQGGLSVFISSTLEDLRQFRTAARDAAISAGFLPIMMEYFTASGEFPPLESCLNRLSEANVLVAIVAHRYGWKPFMQPPHENYKSITWLECERAVAEGKEILAFVVDDKFDWPASEREEHRLTTAVREGRGRWYSRTVTGYRPS